MLAHVPRAAPLTDRIRPQNELPARLQPPELVEDQDFELGHVFHGEGEAFAAEAGVLDPAVGHAVDADAGNVADTLVPRADG